MIQSAFITAWRDRAPWALDEQVEQDLVLSRAIVEIFGDPLLSTGFAFRGGTALHKLYLSRPARYSEDIDLVQIEAGPIAPAMDAIRGRIGPWLGKPKWKQGHGRVTFVFRFPSENPLATILRLKVEINTRERLSTSVRPSIICRILIPLCTGASPECVLAIEDGRGARLHLELKGATPAHLETMVRALWSLAR